MMTALQVTAALTRSPTVSFGPCQCALFHQRTTSPQAYVCPHFFQYTFPTAPLQSCFEQHVCHSAACDFDSTFGRHPRANCLTGGDMLMHCKVLELHPSVGLCAEEDEENPVTTARLPVSSPVSAADGRVRRRALSGDVQPSAPSGSDDDDDSDQDGGGGGALINGSGGADSAQDTDSDGQPASRSESEEDDDEGACMTKSAQCHPARDVLPC